MKLLGEKEGSFMEENEERWQKDRQNQTQNGQAGMGKHEDLTFGAFAGKGSAMWTGV